MKNSEKYKNLILMERCGHYLYHRRGGKRGQGRILKILIDKGEMTQKELQDYLEIQAGSLSEIVSKLVANGLVSRTKDEIDRRKIKLQITEEGRKFFEEKIQERIEEEKKLFNCLSEDEKEQLGGILTKLLDSWQSSDEKNDSINKKHNNCGKCNLK